MLSRALHMRSESIKYWAITLQLLLLLKCTSLGALCASIYTHIYIYLYINVCVYVSSLFSFFFVGWALLSCCLPAWSGVLCIFYKCLVKFVDVGRELERKGKPVPWSPPFGLWCWGRVRRGGGLRFVYKREVKSLTEKTEEHFRCKLIFGVTNCSGVDKKPKLKIVKAEKALLAYTDYS